MHMMSIYISWLMYLYIWFYTLYKLPFSARSSPKRVFLPIHPRLSLCHKPSVSPAPFPSSHSVYLRISVIRSLIFLMSFISP